MNRASYYEVQFLIDQHQMRFTIELLDNETQGSISV